MSIQELAYDINARGGTPILVGGFVRDMVMAGKTGLDFETEVTTTDYDIEVFGMTLPRLKDCLEEFGYRYDEVGEHFAVLKVRVPGVKNSVDISIPRYEKSTGSGHREFEVMADPNLTFAEAAKRRDFTMNALGFDLISGGIHDPYGGIEDINFGIIRHVSNQFAEDPLRPLRAARFAARFNYSIAPETRLLCTSMYPLSASLPAERIWGEVEKAIHESAFLGDFFRELRDIGWINLFPAVADLIGIKQDREWHPEGDVFTHTVAALNYWSQNLRTGNKEDDLITAIAILCHDFGKVTTSEWNEEKQHITAYGHEQAGAEPTRTFLHRLRQYKLAEEVVPLVENHLAPVYADPTPRMVRRLSTKVKRMDLLANLSRADQAGRPPKPYDEGFAKIDKFEQTVTSLEIPQGGPKPLVGGDYFISIGLKPGPAFKTILDDVYERQLDGEINTELEAHHRVHLLVREWELN